jgi:hypothetical protein
MKVSGQFHAMVTLPPEKGLLILIGQEAGWAPEPISTLWSGDIVNERDYVSEYVAVYSKTGASKWEAGVITVL